MNLRLTPYREYKDSGLPWLGGIPRHWHTGPGFAAFREKQVKNTGMKEKTVLSLSYGRIVVKPTEKLHWLVPLSFDTYQIVDPGDIIVRSTDLQNDWNSLRVGLVRDRGIITSAYLCFGTTGALIPEYGYLQLHAFDLMKVFYGMGSGLRQNLDFSDFKRMLIFVPPTDEQAGIVRFLDHADRRIRRYIRAKRRLIELLNEEKQAIIQQAVTRGLDPNVLLKPSGIGWAGNVPERWKFVSLGYLATKFGSGVTPRGGAQVYQSTGIAFLRSQNVYFDGLRLGSVAHISEALHAQLSATHVRPGDVLLNITGASIGRACSVPDDFTEGNVNQHVCIIRPRPTRLLARFLAAYLTTPLLQTQMYLAQNGASREGLTLQAIRSLKIALPPLNEQQAIVDAIDSDTATLRATAHRADAEIDLIREYRTRLIADVVTGKLDVRAVELPHPEEAEELAPVADEVADDTTEEGTELQPIEEMTDAAG